jgi:hypothetical protein
MRKVKRIVVRRRVSRKAANPSSAKLGALRDKANSLLREMNRVQPVSMGADSYLKQAIRAMAKVEGLLTNAFADEEDY